ncbi:MAG: hypothetical protein IKY44_01860 [Clostridia bacterium]|nr:hypothetical protein [Clostridia bacterium]
MNLNTMLRLSKALKMTAKAARLLQVAVVAFATYKAVRLACTMVDSKDILG